MGSSWPAEGSNAAPKSHLTFCLLGPLLVPAAASKVLKKQTLRWVQGQDAYYGSTPMRTWVEEEVNLAKLQLVHREAWSKPCRAELSHIWLKWPGLHTTSPPLPPGYWQVCSLQLGSKCFREGLWEWFHVCHNLGKWSVRESRLWIIIVIANTY